MVEWRDTGREVRVDEYRWVAPAIAACPNAYRALIATWRWFVAHNQDDTRVATEVRAALLKAGVSEEELG